MSRSTDEALRAFLESYNRATSAEKDDRNDSATTTTVRLCDPMDDEVERVATRLRSVFEKGSSDGCVRVFLAQSYCDGDEKDDRRVKLDTLIRMMRDRFRFLRVQMYGSKKSEDKRLIDIYEIRDRAMRQSGTNRTSTADTWKRKVDKQKVEKRLRLAEFGTPGETIRIEDKQGELIATGYVRVLYGDHGAYVEIDPSEHLVSDYFTVFKRGEYYDVVRGVRGAKVSGYHQIKPVLDKPNPPPSGHGASSRNRSEGYADYMPNMYYVDVKKIHVRRSGDSHTYTMSKPNKKREMTTRDILCESLVAHAFFPDRESASEQFMSCPQGSLRTNELVRLLRLSSARALVRAMMWAVKGSDSCPISHVVVVTTGDSPPTSSSCLLKLLEGMISSCTIESVDPLRMSDLRKLIGHRRGEFVVPLVPLVRNALAKEHDLHAHDKAMMRIAQTPIGRKRRRRWQTKSPHKMRRHQRIIFQRVENAALLITDSVMRLDLAYFHLYSGLVLSMPPDKLKRSTCATVVLQEKISGESSIEK